MLELHHAMDGSSASPNYARRFSDGLVQFAGISSKEWASEPGHTWVLYGHIASEIPKPTK